MIVRQVMVTRTDMVICPITATLSRLLELINASGHSRIPIFEGTTDGIVGVVYAKDLLRYWGANDDTLSVAAVMRPPFFVPETKAVEDLLQDFRSKRVHMAIVIDEYGGTSGLVTIEDLLEEIVGDIQDEFDREEDWLIVESDGGVLVDGRLNIADLEEHFDLEIPRDKFDTVGGYLVNLNGQVPASGEYFTDSGLTLEVVAADQRKVSKVRIRRAAGSSDVESYE
jgi:magnesium and cobalt transporter